MGPEADPDRPGVVDAELKVHGIEGLRICDTSVFPGDNIDTYDGPSSGGGGEVCRYDEGGSQRLGSPIFEQLRQTY